MRKIEAQTINAVRDLLGMADHDGRYFKSGNMEVTQSHHGVAYTPGYQRIISVRPHGNEIAAIRPDEGTVWVSDCGWQTVTTKSRINTIIRCLTRHGKDSTITQRNHKWVQVNNGAAYEWKGQDIFPLALDADNWMLRTAERLGV